MDNIPSTTQPSPRVAIVSGGARGIGLAVCRRLAKDGFRVYGLDIEDRALLSAMSTLRDEGLDAHAMPVDIGDEAAIQGLPARLGADFDRAAVLVNNAGISPKGPDGRKIPVVDLPLATWNDVLRINLTGAFLLSRLFLRPMLAQGWGRIINNSSLGGRTASSDVVSAAYNASKAGMIGLTRALAREVSARGVTVNVVCPGRIETPMARTTTSEVNADYLKRTLVGRFGTPEEVADLIAYLASDGSGFMTGATLDINGGVWMG